MKSLRVSVSATHSVYVCRSKRAWASRVKFVVVRWCLISPSLSCRPSGPLMERKRVKKRKWRKKMVPHTDTGQTHWSTKTYVYHQHLCLHWPLIFLSHAITFSRCRAHLCTIKLYSYVYVHTRWNTHSQTGKKVDRYTPCRVMTMNIILCSKWNEIVRSLYP